MKCPFCNDINTQVKDSRPFNKDNEIKRRRVCGACGARFTTLEAIQLKELKVVKKDGSYQLFEREKLLRSIEIATRKRSIPKEKIGLLLNNITHKLEKIQDAKITTKLIGKLIIEQLAQIDQVACIRFASVYMNFNDSHDFIKIIKSMEEKEE